MTKSAKERRKERRERLAQRHKEAYQRKDSWGASTGIFKSPLPEGVTMWKCGEGEHMVDIIPFVAGDKIPLPDKPGEESYILDVWAHSNVGPGDARYICLARTLEEACPVCEEQDRMRDSEEYDDEEIKALNPSRRAIYNIICRDNPKEEAKGIQVWEIAHWFMAKHLDERSKKPKGGGYVYYTLLDEGKTVYFKRKGTSQKGTEFLAHDFLDRDPLDEELVDKAHALDQLIAWPEYEEVYNAFHKKPPSEEETPPDADEPEDEGARGEPEPSESEPPSSDEEPEEGKSEPEGAEEDDSQPGKLECPGGGKFGIDFEELEHCKKCEVWDPCDEAYTAYKKRKEEKKPALVGRRGKE
jgi:hypothetical protein